MLYTIALRSAQVAHILRTCYAHVVHTLHTCCLFIVYLLYKEEVASLLLGCEVPFHFKLQSCALLNSLRKRTSTDKTCKTALAKPVGNKLTIKNRLL